ncbi:hypothetical protein MHU86_12563 [Fragilaria crotonensis]|nr:hypothetical protein MHU86_12563 [Fragilaria crotonensis]
MMGGSTASVSPAPLSLPPDDDPVFGFSTSKWIEPPEFDPKPPEIQKDRNNRLHSEADFRNSHIPTAWHRYSVLGRYAVNGELFEMAWNESETDPTRLHSIIWYNYTYQIERKMLIPDKLEVWATKISQPLLAVKEPSIMTTDTLTTTWQSIAATKGFSMTPWKKVGPQKGRSQSAKASKSMDLHSLGLTRSFRKSFLLVSPPKTIQEEAELPPVEASPDVTPPVETFPVTTKELSPLGKTASQDQVLATKQTAEDNSTASSDGKISAIIPNTNVPVNDGTYRITIGWKTKIDPTNNSRQAASLSKSIYDFLNDLFSDDDGLLYHWGTEGLERYNLISNMTPQEVRSFISPSVTLMPSQSMMIIPIRFGFTSNTPSTWRNQDTTKAVLDKYKVTVSFSNSKSTSGKLVIAGYVLLKAPMTTHRLRYLQFLRSTLPDSTPGFDILLHRRTPLDQEINHLAIQCGEKHVHPICQVLIANLTGDRSPVYIPRFAFADMTKEQAGKLFETHDTYIKSLKGIPLFPMFANLDTIRTEYQDDGTTIERTIREWSKTITLSDGKTYIPCDVVNGGYDQKAYLLVPPQYEQHAAIEALETYRRKVFPFTQREARFRADIGLPSVIHVNSKLKANLSFLENLSALSEHKNTATQDKGSETHSVASDKQYSVDSEFSMVSNESDDSKHDGTAKRPPTPLESIRNQYRTRSVDNATASTSFNSLSGKSRQSMLSTSSARFIELEAQITRQQTEFDRKDKISSDRLAQIERQLHRFDEVDTKLDSLKSDIDSKLDASQQVQREDLKNMNGQILVVMENQAGFGASM